MITSNDVLSNTKKGTILKIKNTDEATKQKQKQQQNRLDVVSYLKNKNPQEKVQHHDP